MPDVLSSKEMRSLENRAFESGHLSSRSAMERAGQGVARSLLENWSDLQKDSTTLVVLCGPGNNGGDGFVIARHLQTAGFQPEAFFYGAHDGLSDDAHANFNKWVALNGKTTSIGWPHISPVGMEALQDAFGINGTLVIVDALFGIGLSRPIEALIPVLLCCRSRRARHPFPYTRSLAVDVPSGLADHGVVGSDPEMVLPADLTVTFHRLKQAHLAAPELCGKVEIVDIGL